MAMGFTAPRRSSSAGGGASSVNLGNQSLGIDAWMRAIISTRDLRAPPLPGVDVDMYMPGRQHVHMKTVTITELRRNIFRLIDETLETGEPIVLNRKGKRLVLSRGAPTSP